MASVLDQLLERYPTAKRGTLKRMVQDGRVTVNGRRVARLAEEVPDGGSVRVADRLPQGPAIAGRAARLPFTIVFEDGDLLVVNKPAGLLTSTVPREPRPTLLAAVRAYLAQSDPAARVGLIHRLDRDAAGLLVFSKTDSAYESLKTQFFKHTVTRVYTAITVGVPSPDRGQIGTRLLERADGTVYSTTVHAKGQRAITNYETISHLRGRAVVRVTLYTGRKHQIRVHLAERKTPILGDPVYGKADPAGLHLCATTLAFDHPRTGARVQFGVPAFWEAADSQ